MIYVGDTVIVRSRKFPNTVRFVVLSVKEDIIQGELLECLKGVNFRIGETLTLEVWSRAKAKTVIAKIIKNEKCEYTVQILNGDSQISKRKHERYFCNLEAFLIEDIKNRILITDISISGCFIETNMWLSKGDKVNILIPSLSINIEGVVVRKSSKCPNAYGVEFLTYDIEAISNYIEVIKRDLISLTR